MSYYVHLIQEVYFFTAMQAVLCASCIIYSRAGSQMARVATYCATKFLYSDTSILPSDLLFRWPWAFVMFPRVGINTYCVIKVYF
jgi:hypothetical protein